jgi:hypothetical protein
MRQIGSAIASARKCAGKTIARPRAQLETADELTCSNVLFPKDAHSSRRSSVPRSSAIASCRSAIPSQSTGLSSHSASVARPMPVRLYRATRKEIHRRINPDRQHMDAGPVEILCLQFLVLATDSASGPSRIRRNSQFAASGYGWSHSW